MAFSRPKKVSKRGIKGDGRPSKLTPAVMAKLKEAFALGLTDDQAAAVVNISDVTLTLWKRNPAFMAEIRGAITERLMVRLKRIEQGENGWQGCGWLLERLLPRQWAKPEILIAVQNNISTGNGAHHFETMVLSDLQFSKLREHPNYSHRPHERPARDVKATVVSNVPESLSGTLVTQNHLVAALFLKVRPQSRGGESSEPTRRSTRLSKPSAAPAAMVKATVLLPPAR
jgi:hypothetical protein